VVILDAWPFRAIKSLIYGPVIQPNSGEIIKYFRFWDENNVKPIYHLDACTYVLVISLFVHSLRALPCSRVGVRSR
jgi:hypothetical protein